MYYSTTALLALMVLLIENQDIFLNRNKAFEKPAWKVYRHFLFSVLVYYVTDILWGLLENYKLPHLLFADTSVYFIAMAAGILFWTQYLVIYMEEKRIFGKFMIYAGRILAALVAVLVCANIFMPILFTVDENCVYSALSARYIILAIQISLLLAVSVFSFIWFIRHRAETRLRYRTIALFGLIMAIFLFAQLWFPYLPLYSIAYLFGTCLIRSFVLSDEKEAYRHDLSEVERTAELEQAKEQRKAYSRLSALTGNLLVFYIIDPESGYYSEYNASAKYEDLGIRKQGKNFFAETYENSARTVHPDDLDMFRSLVTKQNVMDAISRDSVFVIDYRLLAGSSPTYVRLKAAKVEEDGETHLIIGLMDVDAQVRQEQEYENDLHDAKKKASRDALTGVKNKFAYIETENQINEQIKNDESKSFAVVVCDINGLKTVNDTEGHKQGDRLIQEACGIICNIFKHSPVFRVGGDEFAVICHGHDYDNIEELMQAMSDANAKNGEEGKVQVACGMARFDNDENVEDVFERADRRMYVNKAQIKS